MDIKDFSKHNMSSFHVYHSPKCLLKCCSRGTRKSGNSQRAAGVLEWEGELVNILPLQLWKLSSALKPTKQVEKE